MAETLENLDNILHDWVKDKVQESPGIEQVPEAQSSGKKKDKAVSVLENDSEKMLEQSQSAVERDETKHKIGLGKPKTIALSRKFNKPNKQNFYEINLFKTLNFSQSQNNC